MINKLSDLKMGEIYYIIDDFDGYPMITEIKVIDKRKGIRVVENIRHLKDDEELEEDFYFCDYGNYQECRFTDIGAKELKNIIISNNKNDLIPILEQSIRKREEELNCHDLMDYTPPEQYPDWNGDESIMYYLDNYVEGYDEDEEEDN